MTRFRQTVDPEAAKAYRAAGWWGDATLVDHLRRHVASQPDSPAYIPMKAPDEGTET